MLPNRKSGLAPRRPWVISVEVRLPEDGTSFAALATDLSSDGLLLSTFRDIATGSAVILHLALPGGTLTIDAMVAQASSGEAPTVRILFESLPEDARRRIQALARPRLEDLPAKVA